MLPWVLSGLAVALAAALLLRVRLRLDMGPDRRTLFLGIAGAGASLDFAARPPRLRLLGIPVGRRGPRRRGKRVEGEPREERPPPSGGFRRLRPFLALLPAVARAFGRFLADLGRATRLEVLEADLEGGFADPSGTGMAFGWYKAALGAVPSLRERVRYRPDWEGPSLRARVRASAAVPLGRLAWSLALLAIRLPKRRLLRAALAMNRGD